MKSKKIFYGFGTVTILVTPTIFAISCGASEIIYKVYADNPKDKNYILTTTDQKTLQPVVFDQSKKATRFWDIPSPDAKNKDSLNKFLGVPDAHQNMNFGIKSGKEYKNGLEWIIYDVIRAKDQKKDLKLTTSLTNQFVVIPKANMVSQTTRIKYIKTDQFVTAFLNVFHEFKLLKIVNNQWSLAKIDKTVILEMIAKMSLT